MAVAKNTSPEKKAPARRTAVLEEETPRKTRSTAKTSIEQPKAVSSKPGPAHEHALLQKKPGLKPALATSAVSLLEERPMISPELRLHMIRDAAYFRAERRGFTSGDPMQDWIEAEAEVDRMLEDNHFERTGSN